MTKKTPSLAFTKRLKFSSWLITAMAANLIQVFTLICLSFFCFISSEELTTVNELIDFQKWFEDQGGKCRCKFTKRDNKLLAVADRQIVEKESILMAPQSLLVNSTTVERYWSNYNHKKWNNFIFADQTEPSFNSDFPLILSVYKMRPLRVMAASHAVHWRLIEKNPKKKNRRE